jgi:hypothetical protein
MDADKFRSRTIEKFEFESWAVRNLAAMLRLSVDEIVDPKELFNRETGVDVLLKTAARKVGFQVTVYHADEGQTSKRGSPMRANEHREAAANRYRDGQPAPYGGWGVADYLPALSHRIEEKAAVSGCHDYSWVDELSLLVVSPDPRHGATITTLIYPPLVRTADLDRIVGPLLSASEFDSAYLMLLADDGVVFAWSNGEMWKRLTAPSLQHERHRRAMSELIFGTLRNTAQR